MHSRCVDLGQDLACVGLPEGSACDFGNVPSTCRAGVCERDCGDGVVTGTEMCDGANLDGKTCIDQGYYVAAGLACTPECGLDLSGCVGGRCGDGALNGHEACTLESLAERLGVTRERVRQIQIEALAQLRRVAKRRGFSKDVLL